MILLLIGASTYAVAADKLKKNEVWITGDVFEQNGELKWRCDEAVEGNTAGNVVYLGATKQVMNVLLPFYMKAAERHKKLRSYGLLIPVDEKTRKSKKPPFLTNRKSRSRRCIATQVLLHPDSLAPCDSGRDIVAIVDIPHPADIASRRCCGELPDALSCWRFARQLEFTGWASKQSHGR